MSWRPANRATNEKPRLRKQPGFSSFTSGNSSYQIQHLRRPPAAMTSNPTPPSAMILTKFQTGICSESYVSACVPTLPLGCDAVIRSVQFHSEPVAPSIFAGKERGAEACKWVQDGITGRRPQSRC